MVVVIDCNILVSCLTSRSPYHIIYQSLVKGKFSLALSVEIMLECEEIIQQKYGLGTANAFLSLLKELPNVHLISLYFKWFLINADPDDNKYLDCFIAGGASYLITDDRHFSILRTISFPAFNILGIHDFIKLLSTLPSVPEL